MYDTHIQTVLSVRGHLVFIEYQVTPEWAVHWWLNPGYYCDAAEPEQPGTGHELLDTLLRVHCAKEIHEALLSEFESRKYAMEQALAAETKKQDIPF